MPDITDTLKADSTQLNAIDFSGDTSHIYTVAGVRVVKGDQPVNIQLAEDDREYRPSKSMRRALAGCWGPDSDTWIGKRFEVYNDPSVKWGGKEVGGIKVRAVSGINKPMKVMLQESSAVRKPHTVQPLPDAPAAPKATPEPIEVRAPKAIDWFAGKDVPQSALEGHVGRPVAEWTHADLDALMAARDELTGGQS